MRSRARRSAVLLVEPISNTKLSDARRWLRQLIGQEDFACELVLTELITNAVAHGDGSHIRVHATFAPDVLDVEVVNSVRELPELSSSRIVAPSPDPYRGRGLQLIRRLAEIDWESANGRISVRAHVPIVA